MELGQQRRRVFPKVEAEIVAHLFFSGQVVILSLVLERHLVHHELELWLVGG